MGEIADFISAAEPLVRRAKDSGRIRGEPEPDDEGDAAREAVLLGNMPHRQKCPVCGKIFVRKKGTGYGWDCYDTCSWTCQRKLEARWREAEADGVPVSTLRNVMCSKKTKAEGELRQNRYDFVVWWRTEASRMIREGMDVGKIADILGVSTYIVYTFRRELGEADGVNYTALAKQARREKYMGARKGNFDIARQMLREGAPWKDILQAARIGAKDLALLKREMDREAEALSAAAAAAPPEGEPSGCVEATDAPEDPPTGDAAKEVQEGDRKALLHSEHPSPEEGAKEVQEGDRKALLQDGTSADAPEDPPTAEPPAKRKRIAAKPAAPSEIGRRLSDRDERELLWAAGVIEMYIDIRPDNSAGRRAVTILRRIAGLED